MQTNPVPTHIDIKKEQGLTIDWADGQRSSYTLSLLRTMCPCALCKEERSEQKARKSLLRVLPGNFATPMAIRSAELVGNYALKLSWSDNHDAGLYTFAYLRELGEETSKEELNRG